MQTNFTPEQLRDPMISDANEILRNCVLCGFCIATCPTYLLLGDELDGPRGRIYLIKGDYDLALDYYEKSLTIAEELGNKSAIGWHLVDIGNIYLERYKFARRFTRE